MCLKQPLSCYVLSEFAKRKLKTSRPEHKHAHDMLAEDDSVSRGWVGSFCMCVVLRTTHVNKCIRVVLEGTHYSRGTRKRVATAKKYIIQTRQRELAHVNRNKQTHAGI